MGKGNKMWSATQHCTRRNTGDVQLQLSASAETGGVQIIESKHEESKQGVYSIHLVMYEMYIDVLHTPSLVSCVRMP